MHSTLALHNVVLRPKGNGHACCKCTKRALSTPTVCTMDREKEGGKDSLSKSRSSFFFDFFLKYFLYFLLYLLIPRHTGHFLRHLWALPDTKHRKGESTAHFACATLFYMWYF